MALTSTLSNHFKYQLAVGNVNFTSDTFTMIMMDTTFVFDPDTHATLTDVTSHQLATGNGYVQNDKTMAGVTVVEDDDNDRAAITWTNVTWTADGGNIGPSGAICVIDTTTADDTVLGCIDFGTDYTIADGSSLQFQNLGFNIN